MNTLHSCLAYYLLAINVVTFIVYGIDKYKAKKAKWRISEATLLLLAVLGGSIGAWMGMKVWHFPERTTEQRVPAFREELTWLSH